MVLPPGSLCTDLVLKMYSICQLKTLRWNVNIDIYLLFILFASLSVRTSVCLCVCPAICFCVSVSLSVWVSVSLFVVCLSVSGYLFLCLSLSVCLDVCLSPSLFFSVLWLAGWLPPPHPHPPISTPTPAFVFSHALSTVPYNQRASLIPSDSHFDDYNSPFCSFIKKTSLTRGTTLRCGRPLSVCKSSLTQRSCPLCWPSERSLVDASAHLIEDRRWSRACGRSEASLALFKKKGESIVRGEKTSQLGTKKLQSVLVHSSCICLLLIWKPSTGSKRYGPILEQTEVRVVEPNVASNVIRTSITVNGVPQSGVRMLNSTLFVPYPCQRKLNIS